MTRPRVKLAGLLVLTIFLTACDSVLTTLRVGFNASQPFVQSLVETGTINQPEADAANKDIDSSIVAAEKGERCINVITVTGKAKKVAKAKCYYHVAQDLREILGRRNFEVNEKLRKYSAIAGSAIEALEAYYTIITTDPTIVGPDGGILKTGADGIEVKNAEKELERALKAAKKDLQELKKSQ